jgi:hypothetical protein
METLYLTRKQLIAFVQTSIGGSKQQRITMEATYQTAIVSQTPPESDILVYAANYMVVCAMDLLEVRNPFPQFVAHLLYGVNPYTNQCPTILYHFNVALFNDELKKRK